MLLPNGMKVSYMYDTYECLVNINSDILSLCFDKEYGACGEHKFGDLIVSFLIYDTWDQYIQY